MVFRAAFLGTVLAAAVVAAEPNLVEDAPPVRSPADGNLAGAISPPGAVSSITAVSRQTAKTYQPAAFDRRTGAFLFRGLPGDATYDLCLTAADGRTIEGIDLSVVDARLSRLAEARRQQLQMPAPRRHAFDDEDANALLDYVRAMEDFMDIRRALYVHGHGSQATVLVEMLRTSRFHAAGADEMIWRIELWYFQYSYGGWERIPNTERVLRRERLAADRWRKIHVEYYPELSVYLDPSGFAPAVAFRLPDRPDPSRGRPAGSEVELKTVPHVLGIQARREEPSTQPVSP